MRGASVRVDPVVLAFLAGHVVERLVNPERQGGLAANAVAAIAMSVPFAWRRTRPLLFVTGVVAGSVLSSLIATPVQELFAAIVTLIAIGFALTRHHDGRDRWVPLGLAAVAVAASELALGGGAVLFVLLVLAGGAVGGWVVRERALLTRELAERTHELEALREARERDAVLDERRRIARELHDVVAHTVSVMVVQSGGARRQLRRDPDRALAAIAQVDATGREALAELDRLFGLLARREDAPCGLADLPALAARTRAAGLPVELAVRGEPRPLHPDADLALFRVVQEALTNTLKHGGPGAAVALAVDWADDAVEVVARDSGWGAAGPRGEGSRRGLAGMRDRLAPHGGSVQAGPLAAGGFEVRARLPAGAREEVPA